MSEAHDRYEAARRDLKELTAELPDFEKLLERSEAHEADLRAKKAAGSATIEDLQDARASALTARQLLEQHHADIETAQVEVERTQREAKAAALVTRLRALGDSLRSNQEEVQALTREALEAFTHSMVRISERHRSMAGLISEWRAATVDLRRLEEHPDMSSTYDRLDAAGVDVQAVQTTPGARGLIRREASGLTRQTHAATPLKVRVPDITRHTLLALRKEATHTVPRDQLDGRDLELAHALGLARILANAARGGMLATNLEEDAA